MTIISHQEPAGRYPLPDWPPEVWAAIWAASDAIRAASDAVQAAADAILAARQDGDR